MVDAFEQAIAEQPAGIIAFGADATLTAVINKAEAAGIHVVLVDGDLADSNRTSFVGTGSYDAGFLGGTKLAESIGGKGQVAIMTVVDAELHQARLAGYKAALEELVQVGDDKADPTTGAAVVSAILQEYPELAGIGCTDATGGASTATAVSEAGKAGQIKIVAMDRDQAVLQGIVDGNVYGTLVQNTALMPLYAIQILYTMNHAEVEISSDNAKAGVVAAPASIDTGVVWVDKANAEYFMRSKG
jgi:ribose transport system substrate-binding protein